MKPSSNKNTSVFLDGDLSHAEAQRRGENVGRKERIDRKAWTHVRLGNYATLLAGGTPSRSVSDYYGGSIPWCSISDISGAGKFLIRTAESLTRLGIENSTAKLIPADAILFAMYASIGECALATTPLATSQAILGIYNLKEFDREYLYYYLCSQKEVFINQGQTGTQSNLSKEIVSNIQVPKPSIKEQRRIANSLSSIDANIATVQSLFSKYEAIKKATVNLLLKPKDNWHSIKLKEFESHKNNTCSRSLTTANSGRIHNIHYGDILVRFNEIVSLKDCRIDCLTNEGELRSPADYIQDGDIIIADTAEDETAGKIVEMRDLEDNKAVAGLHTVFLRPPKTLFARGWLGYWMNSRYYHDQLLPYMTGIKVLSLSRSSLSRTEVFYPSRLEQERIVSVFESINSHISALQCQAEKMQKLKDGMMTYFFG